MSAKNRYHVRLRHAFVGGVPNRADEFDIDALYHSVEGTVLGFYNISADDNATPQLIVAIPVDLIRDFHQLGTGQQAQVDRVQTALNASAL